ncbi:ROK family protein [Microbacterium sp. NC79]|uniref:ROK family protein n=1 Tax=Microbacterium sp. NC79 TaxID=2851009 RepID=UPI001C2CB515|nr:ROK family protein [Microbacterium sp. NC79]
MTQFVVALDLGGTKLDGALVSHAGDVVAGSRTRVPTGRTLSADALTAALAQVVSRAAAAANGAPITGIGIGAPGPIASDGTLASVNLPGVHGFHLETELSRIAEEVLGTAVPVKSGHDAGCLALGEATFGVAREAAAMIGVVVSTGVGCGIVIDGNLVRGTTGNAGHIGQMRDESGVTVEEVAAGPHAVAWARERGFSGTTGHELGAAYAAGDAIAQQAVERSARAVGRALSNVATLLDVDAIVIGGGFSHVATDYLERVRAAIRDSSVLAYARDVAVMVPSLQGEGAIKGAAALALSQTARNVAETAA